MNSATSQLADAVETVRSVGREEPTAGHDSANLLMPEEGESWDGLRRRLAVTLNLTAVDPQLDLAPSGFVNRMINDDAFAHLVLSSRSSPAFLRVLLNHATEQFEEKSPPRVAEALFSGASEETAPPISQAVIAASKHSDRHLVAKAARSFARWAKNGFTRADEVAFQRRMAACLACDQLAAPPDQLLYKIATTGSSERSVCKACGCVANRKARLSTENCPLAHPDNPLLSRWGEPRSAH
jgi:hypothetical protein